MDCNSLLLVIKQVFLAQKLACFLTNNMKQIDECGKRLAVDYFSTFY